ncbi:hypothetical protein ECG_03541 [Echinococcus granulosus]|uniref:Expressed conserved protein n=1 Tax=Echinococcus granulosus TaxID=6210 RepID=A0A068X0Q7_ECHGR|nr:hypothetical protein ECG_03541 [Echinococcus granulosus]CDS23504.1 hypothetical protein EgrG_000719500 [Echinococcus granulosus]
MKCDRVADPTPMTSEDPYEETPFVDSQYLTPRSLTSYEAQSSRASTSVNRGDLEEQPLPPSAISAAVDYTPGEAVYGRFVTLSPTPPPSGKSSDTLESQYGGLLTSGNQRAS